MRGRRKMPFSPMPIEAWPETDQRLWEVARCTGDLLDEPGPAATWASGTAAHAVLCYGYWLNWLEREGHLDPTAQPADRITVDRARQFLEVLETNLAPQSVALVMARLYSVLKALQPAADLAWLQAAKTRITARAFPTREITPRLVDSARLVQAGLDLMAEAETRSYRNPRTRALAFRDGLMLAVLALRPVRIGNFAGMTLDRHLEFDGDLVRVRFPAEEVKTRRPLAFLWPSDLVPALRTYLTVHRPTLLAEPSSQLWLGRTGPIGLHGCMQAIRATTRRMLGVEVPPHFFRHAAATTVALHDPENTPIITSILGHSTLRTSEKHYNMARSAKAARDLQATVRLERRKRPTVHEGA